MLRCFFSIKTLHVAFVEEWQMFLDVLTSLFIFQKSEQESSHKGPSVDKPDIGLLLSKPVVHLVSSLRIEDPAITQLSHLKLQLFNGELCRVFEGLVVGCPRVPE